VVEHCENQILLTNRDCESEKLGRDVQDDNGRCTSKMRMIKGRTMRGNRMLSRRSAKRKKTNELANPSYRDGLAADDEVKPVVTAQISPADWLM
jgi:hypothetical protein